MIRKSLLMVLGIGIVLWAGATMAADGDNAFVTQKCNMCHAVSSAGIEAKVKMEKMKGPDLAGVSTRYDSEWLGKFLRREVQLNDTDHKKEYKGTDDDLKALIAWLSSEEAGGK